SRELDEAAPVDAGKVLGAGLALAALGLLAPAAFGGRIGQSYDISLASGALEAVRTPFGELAILGSPHLVTSVFFDVGVYLVVVVLLASNGVNVLFLVVSGAAGGAPITGVTEPQDMSDPLPQAFVLTAIVITLAVTAFLLALAYRSFQITGHDEVSDDVEDAA